MIEARHPMFNGTPIMLGDTITFDNEPSGYGGPSTGVVTTIRMVRGEPWIHVTEDGADRERNEVIFDNRQDNSGRHVIAHTPKEK